MSNLLYTIAVILLVLWAVGYSGVLGYQNNDIIHVLLVIAVIAVLLRVIQGRQVL